MGQRITSTRPDRKTMQVRPDDYAVFKQLTEAFAPLKLELITVIKAARLALQSLPDDQRTQFLHQAAAETSPAAVPTQ